MGVPINVGSPFRAPLKGFRVDPYENCMAVSKTWEVRFVSPPNESSTIWGRYEVARDFWKRPYSELAKRDRPLYPAQSSP